MKKSFYCGEEHLMILAIVECSVLSLLSSSPIRCVIAHCGLSLSCHRDRKVKLANVNTHSA